MRRWILAICLTVLALPLHAGDTATPPAVGELPPQELGKQWRGGPVNLADHRGKVVIVTFWASWCGPCRKELPILAHFQKAVGRDALQVFAINYKESPEDFHGIVRANREFDLDYIHDRRGRTSDLYGVRSLPHMFILDQEGRVAHVHRGYSEELLPGIVKELLALLPEEVRNRPTAAGG